MQREREEAEALAALLNILAEVWENHLPILHARLADRWDRYRGRGADGILSAARHRLLERRPVLHFDSIGKAIDYLLQAVDSEVLDRARKRATRLETDDQQALEALAVELRSRPSPEDVAIGEKERSERTRFLRDCKAALGELSPKQREVVELRWLCDARPKFRDIGERLGISEDAARMRHGRAISRLRGLLGLE